MDLIDQDMTNCPKCIKNFYTIDSKGGGCPICLSGGTGECEDPIFSAMGEQEKIDYLQNLEDWACYNSSRI